LRRFTFTSALCALSGCASAPDLPPAPVIDSYQPSTQQAELAEVRAAVAPYRDIEGAKRNGWKPFGGDGPLMGQHWYSKVGADYVHGDELDFSRPSNLMYTKIGDAMVLTGVAFVVRLAPGEPLPEGFAGDEDRWHVHDVVAAIEAATEDRPVLGWLAGWWLDAHYRSKGDNRSRLAMVHAWVTLPNPDGVFADYNRVIPYLKLALPDLYAQGASEAAARGLSLATEDGCRNQLRGQLWLADASRAQEERLMQTCESAATSLRTALNADKAAINEAGERAWTLFDRAYQAELTVEQKRRIASVTEHHAHGHGGADDDGHPTPR
jgi:hypothetical protein